VEVHERSDRESQEAASAELGAFDELQVYTLTHGDPAFIHQYVVDAWTAQHADEHTKPIALTFALVGLYLHLEKGASGRQVQRIHMALARRKWPWPSFALPGTRGSVTARQVMAASAGPERDRAIEDWCASVWNAFRCDRAPVIESLQERGLE
jgi:Family of unknown function (DUF5946)